MEALTPADLQSDTFRKLTTIWSVRKQDLQDQISQPLLSSAQRDHLAGRIEELSFNLAQPKYIMRADQDTIEPGDVSSMY